jgi:hypothetical protein
LEFTFEKIPRTHRIANANEEPGDTSVREPTRIEMQELTRKTKNLIATGLAPEVAASQVLADWEYRENEKARLDVKVGSGGAGLRVSIGEMIARKLKTA